MVSLFPKMCLGCHQEERKQELICQRCMSHFNLGLRYECACCSRDRSSCSFCQKPSSVKRVLACFESTHQTQSLLKRAKFLSAHGLAQAIANALWIRLISTGLCHFDAVMPFSKIKGPFSWSQYAMKSPLNQTLASWIAQKLKQSYRSPLGWKVEHWLWPRRASYHLLIVASTMSEEEITSWARSLEKVQPNVELTFLIGCWKDDGV